MRGPVNDIEAAIDAIVSSFIADMTANKRKWVLKARECKKKAKRAKLEGPRNALLSRHGYYMRQVGRATGVIDRCLASSTRDGEIVTRLERLDEFFASLDDHNLSQEDLAGFAAFERSEQLRPLGAKVKTLLHIERAYPDEVHRRARKIIDLARVS